MMTELVGSNLEHNIILLVDKAVFEILFYEAEGLFGESKQPCANVRYSGHIAFMRAPIIVLPETHSQVIFFDIKQGQTVGRLYDLDTE